jgi:hypothetical protein
MQAPHEFYIALHPVEDARKDSLEKLHKEATTYNGAAFALPAEIGAFPIPNETCSTVISHGPSLDSFQEALRVTRTGGTIIVDCSEDIDPRVFQIAQAFLSTIVNRRIEGETKRNLVIQKDLLL